MLKKYFALFETETGYSDFLQSREYVTPNVSLIKQLRKLYFNKKEAEGGIMINGVRHAEKVITLAAGGSYEISGVHEGQIIIDAKTSQPADYTYVRFNDVTILSDEAYGFLYDTPENNKGYKGVILSIERDSRNFIVCNKANATEDDRTFAALDSWKEITVQGIGYLALYNNIGHALRGEDVTIGGTHIYVDAVHDGIHGKNINILDGIFYIKNAKDGFGTTDNGKINIFGGSFEHDNIEQDMFDSKQTGYFVDETVFGSYEHANIVDLSTKYEAGTVIGYNAANPNGIEITPSQIFEAAYEPSAEIPAQNAVYSFTSYNSDGSIEYGTGTAELISTNTENNESIIEVKTNNPIDVNAADFVGQQFKLDITEYEDDTLYQLLTLAGEETGIAVKVALVSAAVEHVAAGANAVLNVTSNVAYTEAYDLTGFTSAVVSGKIVKPLIFPLWAQIPEYPLEFSAKGKLKSYTGNFDLTLDGAYIVTSDDCPSILYSVDVDRLKITAVKDKINAVINTNIGGVNDLDAIKSENNISLEIKNGGYLYVSSKTGDGIDGGDVKITDSKGNLVVTNCGERGIKGAAIVIGPNADINQSTITSYYTDPADAQNYTIFNGIAVVKNNCKVKAASEGIVTAADADVKLTGFADIYARNGKHKKGVFGTTNAELKGAIITGTMGAAVSMDMGDANNLYYKSTFKIAENAIPPVVERYKAVPYNEDPIL